MANGEIIQETVTSSIGAFSRTIKLLDKVTAGNNNGKWVPFDLFAKGTIEVKGLGTATLHLCGSNDNDPADTDHGTQIGADITANGFVYLSNPYRFIKMRVSTYSSGTINAILHAVSP